MSVKYFNKEKNEWVIFPGTIGAPGEDSYQIAVNHGYKGTYEEYQHMIAIMPDVLMKATDFVNNIDEIPTENSDHLVKSGGVYSSIKNVETLVNDKSSELNSKIEEAKSEIENNINPKLDELNDRITDVESDLNGSLDDLEKIVIENKNDSDNSISDLEKSFDDKMQEVLDNLNNKANVSDIPTDYVTPDVIEGVYSAIDNIDTTVSAEEVATVLDADMIAGVVNGSLKIEGTAITDGAIATRHMIANTISGTVITGGTIIGDKIAANTLTSNHIKGSALNGLTIEDGAGKWKLNKDGSGYLASQNIKWDTSGNVTFGSGVTIAWSNEQQKQVDDAKTAANNAETNSKKYTDQAKSDLLASIDGKVDSKYTEKIGSKLTYIDKNGIYTGTLTADQMVAIDIDASRITSGTISANRLNLKDYLTVSAADSKYAAASAVNTLNTTVSNLKTKVNSVETSVGAKATLSDVITALSKAPTGSTTINGGWIDTNAITVRSSKIVDDNNNPVTIITSKTLATTNVIAENLRVKAANINGTLSASKITGTIEGLTIQSGNAWILNKDGSGHVANGNLSWDASGNVAGTGAFTGAAYTGSIMRQARNSNDSTKTIELVHQVGLFNSNFGSMYTYENGYAIPKYVTVMVNPISTYTETQESTGNTVSYTATNIIEVIDNLRYSGVKQKLNPYEYKIINIGNAPLHIYKGGRSIGVIPTNSYTNIFMYTDENDTVQCYFQS